MNKHTGLLFLLLPLLLCLAAKGPLLKYDDGRQDDKQSFGGNGHAIRFDRPSDDFVITEVHLFGSQYGQVHAELDLGMLYICDENLAPVHTSTFQLGAFRRGKAKWVEIEIKPVKAPEKFFVLVDFLATGTKGVYLGIDGDSKGHSMSAVPGKGGKALDKGNWMIRVQGSTKIKVEPEIELNPETEKELFYDDGERDSYKSMAGDGHAVQFIAPKGEWYMSHVSLHGCLYGGKYDPARTFFNVYVCDARMKVLAQATYPYSLFPFGTRGDWVAVDVPHVRVKGKFHVLCSFNPTQTKGVFLSIDESVKKSHSLMAMPERSGKKLGSKKEWMIRASLMEKLEGGIQEGDTEAPESLEKLPEEEGPDALQLAEWKMELEALEAREDREGAEALLATIAREAKEDKESFGNLHITKNVWVKYVNVPETYARAVAKLYESCQESLQEVFGLEQGFCVVPDRRLHVHLLANEGARMSLFTSPGSKDFPLVVNTMSEWKRGLSPPGEGGPHIVYGLCHELGHVLMGWTDSRHQWAHYIGSVLVDEVTDRVGKRLWPKPYDYKAEGMERFMGMIENAVPNRETDEGMARLYYDVGETFGKTIWGKVLPWIRENREGEPFREVESAVRLYKLDDVRDALIDLKCDKTEVEKLIGS